MIDIAESKVRLVDRENRCDDNDYNTSPDHSAETFKLFTEGDDLYASILAAIVGARESFRLESYIFADDVEVNQFCEALVERALAGVKVRVPIETVDSLFWFSRKLHNRLRGNAVQFRWFHRWSWRRP